MEVEKGRHEVDGKKWTGSASPLLTIKHFDPEFWTNLARVVGCFDWLARYLFDMKLY